MPKTLKSCPKSNNSPIWLHWLGFTLYEAHDGRHLQEVSNSFLEKNEKLKMNNFKTL